LVKAVILAILYSNRGFKEVLGNKMEVKEDWSNSWNHNLAYFHIDMFSLS